MPPTPNMASPHRRRSKTAAASPARQAATPSRSMKLPPRVGTPRKTPRKLDSDSAAASGGEGIQVAIRMRPLNTNEGNYRRVWKVLPRYSSVTQTTLEGKPLPEKVTNRTFFTFDKTFGEEIDTKTVYESCAKGIVDSVVSGLNGTIFAYGQTSSGKTFTMQGSGTIAQGSASHAGGIVHMAANDIFQHIQDNPDRLFLVRASFLEIYNEEVRDLLSPDQKVLQIREDPRRGVFVQSQEEYVTDYESLLQILFTGEKSRAFASTAMNERSSRSHTIFRITIESHVKTDDKEAEDSDDEQSVLSRPDGAVRVATLNLVDLAGSESVRHTGATGDRQKEGGMINQSLLTLSRVIVALGQPNQTHINFRDSKLTRILQPSLSGNARMAIICCATPSELYLEETRSTLQFASRAKLVKTNAQVNEVLDDRSLIRRLQKELAEARAETGGAPSAKVKALEEKVATAGSVAHAAKEKLRKLQASILNHEGLFAISIGKVDSKDVAQRKRRRSDGTVRHFSPSFLSTSLPQSPKTLPRPEKKTRIVRSQPLSTAAELVLMREALRKKSQRVEHFQSQINDICQKVQDKEEEVKLMSLRNNDLESERNHAMTGKEALKMELFELRDKLSKARKEHEKVIQEKDTAMQEILTKLEQQLEDRRVLEETIDCLQQDKGKLNIEQKTLSIEHTDLKEKFHELQEFKHRSIEEKNSLMIQREENQKEVNMMKNELETVNSSLREANQVNEDLTAECERKDALIKSLQDDIHTERQDRKTAEIGATERIEAVQKQFEAYRKEADVVKGNLLEEKRSLQGSLAEAKAQSEEVQKQCTSIRIELEASTNELVRTEKENRDLLIRIMSLEEEGYSKKEQMTCIVALALIRMQLEQDTASSTVRSLNQELCLAKQRLQTTEGDVEAITRMANASSERVQTLESQLKQLGDVFEKTSVEFEECKKSRNVVVEEKEELGKKLEHSRNENTKIASLLESSISRADEATQQVRTLESKVVNLETELNEVTSKLEQSEKIKADVELENESLSQKLNHSETLYTDTTSQLEELGKKFDENVNQVQVLKNQLTELGCEHKEIVSELQECKLLLDKEETRKRDLVDQLENSHEEKAGLEAKLLASNEEREDALQQVFTLKTQITDLENNREEVMLQFRNIETLLSEVSSDNECIRNRSEQAELKISNLSAQLDDQRQESKQKEERMATVHALALTRMEMLQRSASLNEQALGAKVSELEALLESSKDEYETSEQEVMALSKEVKDLGAQISVLENDKKSLSLSLVQREEAIVIAHAEIANLKAVAAETESKLDTLNQESISLRNALESMEQNLQYAQDARQTLETENQSMRIKLLRSEETRDELSSRLDSKISDLQELTESFERLTTRLGSLENEGGCLKTDIMELNDRLNQSQTDLVKALEDVKVKDAVIANLNDEKLTTKIEIQSLKDTLESALTEKRTIDIGRDLAQNRLVKLEGKMEQRESHFNEMIISLQDRTEEIQMLQESLRKSKRDVDVIRNDFLSAQVHVDDLTKTQNIFRDNLEKAEKQNCAYREKNESLQTQLLSLQQEMVDTQSAESRLQYELAASNISCEELNGFLADAQAEITRLSANLKISNDQKARLEVAHALLFARLTRTNNSLLDANHRANRLLTDLDLKVNELDTLRNDSKEMNIRSNEIELLLISGRKEKDSLQSQIADLKNDIQSKCAIIEDLKQLGINYEDRLRVFEEDKVEMQNLLLDKEALQSQMTAQEQTLAVMESKLEMQSTEIFSLQAERDDLKARNKVLQSTVEDLEKLVQEKEKDLAALVDELKSSSTTYQEEVNQIRSHMSSQKDAFEEELSRSESEKSNLAEQLQEARRQSNARRDELIQAHDLLETANSSSNKLKKELADMEEALASKDTMLSQAYDALESEKTNCLERIDALSREITSLKESQVHLDNGDATQIGEITVENDELKGLLAAANHTIEEMKVVQEKACTRVEMAESRVLELEELLASSEKNRPLTGRDDSVPDYTEVEQLRSEISRLEAVILETEEARFKVEEESKSRNEEERRTLINDADEKIKNLQNQKEELQISLEKSESEAYASRQLTEELRDEIKQHIDKSIQNESRLAALENENSRLKRSAARFEDEQESKASALKIELKRARDEATSAQDTQHALESRIAVYEERLGQKENELQRLIQSTKDLNVPALEEEIIELKTSLHDTKRRLMEAESIASRAEGFAAQVKQLTSEINTKDDRIKRLEKSKLTKDKIAAMKKMKQENKETKDENDTLRGRLHVAEQALAELEASGGEGHSAEATKLKFDKEALESKLRKYATHCQRLEEERDSVRTVLRSSKIPGADSASVSDLVVTLVDRLTSLEEECDSLSRSENQASSFLVEIENLRQHNQDLRKKIAEANKRLDHFSRMEIQYNETKRALNAQKQYNENELAKERAESGEEIRKLSRKIQRLESEYLQILQDHKAKKEELAKYKSELNAIRLRSPSARATSEPIIKGAQPPVAQSKENSENTNIQFESGARPPRPVLSARKRRHRTPGLGEALEENNENTQDCQQS